MKTIEEALELICAEAKSFGTEEISIDDCFNRILAEDIFADRDYPPFNRSTMDGYAVIAENLKHSKELKLIATVHAGEVSLQKVTSGNCIKIMTGAPVPEGADAVIRFEDTEEKNGTVRFLAETFPNQNIALRGEDAKAGHLLLEKNKKLDALCLSLLSVVGKYKVNVYKLPRVAIVSTGNEIVSIETAILPHQIRDSNSYSINNFLKNYAIENVTSVLVKDDKQSLAEHLRQFLNADVLILSGGVSKGEADYVPEVLQSLGVREIFHRVQIKPGNPLWFGRMPNGGVVFGLPGNPVSVQVGYKVFIEKYLRCCFGLPDIQPLQLPLLSDKAKRSKFTEYFPANLIFQNGISRIAPKPINTSGDIAATAGSDGIAVHPANVDVLKENTMIEFYYW